MHFDHDLSFPDFVLVWLLDFLGVLHVRVQQAWRLECCGGEEERDGENEVPLIGLGGGSRLESGKPPPVEGGAGLKGGRQRYPCRWLTCVRERREVVMKMSRGEREGRGRGEAENGATGPPSVPSTVESDSCAQSTSAPAHRLCGLMDQASPS